jgi:hypothetical protein
MKHCDLVQTPNQKDGKSQLEGNKIYQHSRGQIIQVINDMAELQKARFCFCNTPKGKINFLVRMYHNKWEHRFTVKETGLNQSSVKIEINQENRGSEDQIKREFALLDSMLNDDEQIELISEAG